MAFFSPHALAPLPPCVVRVTLVDRDRNAILAINRQSDHRRDEAQLSRELANPVTIAASALRGPVVVGFALYTYHERSINLEWLAVAKKCRLGGIGRMLVADIARKCGQAGRPILKAIVNEENSAAHKFLARCGFFATRTIRDHFRPSEGSGMARDGYVFALDVSGRDCPGRQGDVP